MERIPAGSRPERLNSGEARYRRFPNEHGGAAACHPDVTDFYVRHGIRFADGRWARVAYVEYEAYVDVIHFYFAERPALRLAA